MGLGQRRPRRYAAASSRVGRGAGCAACCNGARASSRVRAFGSRRLATATTACGTCGRFHRTAATVCRASATVRATAAGKRCAIVLTDHVFGRGRAVVFLPERQRLISERAVVSGAVDQGSGAAVIS